MKGIKRRLVFSYIINILISMIILEILLIVAVKQYYYNNVEEILSNQIRTSSELYSNYYSSNTLKENIQGNSDMFWENTTAQVQIIDTSGNVLMDSIGVLHDATIKTSDVRKALSGILGTWSGKVDYDKYGVISVAYPLKSGKDIIGVIRFVTSLKDVNSSIINASIILVVFGFIVVIIAGVVSIFLSNSILEPIDKITKVAELMALGKFDERVPKRYNDELGKLSDTLNFMAAEITNNEKLKNEFISSISHELRTPLTLIKGWAVTINSGNMGEVSEGIKDAVQIIEKESDRLTSLVEELLDFSKLAAGKTTLKLKDINLNLCISKVITQMQPRAEKSKISLDFQPNEEAVQLNLDENRIRQVLINILDNAFNFTPEKGKIVVDIRREDRYIIISIQDNGIGIPEEDLPRVKEKFFKGNGSNSNSGIGLSICEEIVKLHNGILNIKSNFNNGTEVEVYLPVTNL